MNITNVAGLRHAADLITVTMTGEPRTSHKETLRKVREMILNKAYEVEKVYAEEWVYANRFRCSVFSPTRED